VLVCFIAGSAVAANFAPTVMKVSAPGNILYNFDGKTLNIPVTVSGVGGSAYFLVFTRDKAATISKVKNGYLGWHYVNKIDTCMFISTPQSMTVGNNTIAWDGKGEGGDALTKGDYTYYIWAFDNVNARVQMTKHMAFNPWSFRTIITHDTAGKPLDQPVIYTATENWSKETKLEARMKYKWVVGGDPADATLRETCSVMQTQDHGGLAFDPANQSKFWVCYQANNGTFEVRKFSWVPNGAAIQDQSDLEWGDDGKFNYNTPHAPGTQWGPGLASEGKDFLLAANADPFAPSTTISEVLYISISDGTEVKRIDLSDWWVDVDDGKAGGQATGGPSTFYYKHGALAMGSHSTCINQVLNVYYENEDDAILWNNDNGDIVGDHNWEPTAKMKWVCNDYNVGPYKYNITMDDNLFTMFPSFDMGAVSFGLYAPDGSGIGYLALAGETAAQKFGVEIIDYGSNYDGIYTTNNAGKTLDTSMWYVGHDSIRGMLTSQIKVASESPSAFSVAQNTPNPFNPGTTISFTLAKAGRTTIEVFNAAGQKVDILLNANLDPGAHSVQWNAARRSAGVYFYTVTCGDFSKTMKMTLLK
jgi:hypothetical protein